MPLPGVAAAGVTLDRGPGAVVIINIPDRLPIPAVTAIPIPPVTLAPEATAVVAIMAAAVIITAVAPTTVAAITTLAVERVTLGDSIRGGSSLDMRQEPIIILISNFHPPGPRWLD